MADRSSSERMHSAEQMAAFIPDFLGWMATKLAAVCARFNTPGAISRSYRRANADGTAQIFGSNHVSFHLRSDWFTWSTCHQVISTSATTQLPSCKPQLWETHWSGQLS